MPKQKLDAFTKPLILAYTDQQTVEKVRELIDFSSCYFSDIKSLGDLTYCPNLQIIKINTSGIQNIEALRYLKSLKYLSISSSPIVDISVVSTLPLLQKINFCWCKIQSVTIQGLQKLVELNVSHNKPQSILLKDLPALQQLDLSSNGLQSVELQGLQSLKELDLSYNQLHNVNLSDLPALQNLNLGRNKLKQINGLLKLPLLATLSLYENKLQTIAQISLQTNLKFLDLDKTDIYDPNQLYFISCLPLESIHLRGVQIPDQENFFVSAILTLKKFNGNNIADARRKNTKMFQFQTGLDPSLKVQKLKELQKMYLPEIFIQNLRKFYFQKQICQSMVFNTDRIDKEQQF